MKSFTLLLFLFCCFTVSVAQLVLERDINQEAASSNPAYAAELNNVLYFNADDGINGEELYQYDMATQTAQLVANLRSNEDGSGIAEVYSFDGKIYFSARDGTGLTYYLQEFDPATQLTQRLTDVNNQRAKNAFNLAEFNGQLFFAADFPGSGVELGRYDPVANEIHEIADINPSGDSYPNFLTEYNGYLWFTANDGLSDSRLWRYDPATDTVENVLYLSPTGEFPSMGFLYEYEDIFYFRGFLSGQGEELWGYDPATNSLLDIPSVYPGAGSSSPYGFTGLNGKLYFPARTVIEGRELRVYDPATNQTTLVADLYPTGNGNPGDIVVVADRLYFTASVDEVERRLYSYDPVSSTLNEEASLDNLAAPNFLSTLIAVDSTLFLSGSLEATGNELYQFEAGSSSITLAADINHTTIGSDPYGFTPFQGKLYFGADEFNSGREIWVYDPATGDVDILSDEPGSTRPYGFTPLGNQLFFSGIDPVGGYGLLYVEAATGDLLPTSYLTPTQTGHITDIVAYHDRIYFSADDNGVGREILVYDPPTNTFSVAADIHPTDGSNAEWLFVFNGHLYFQADDGVHGTELWRYNDTTGQATLVADVNFGSNGSSPDYFASYDGELYFNAFVNGLSYGLYSYDPQTDSIHYRTDVANNFDPEYLTVYHDKLFFSGRFPSGVGTELGYYDATLDTVVLAADLNPSSSNPRDLTVFNDKLYFSAFSDGFGRELWQYDDPTASIVTDLRPGIPGSEPESLTLFNGKLYFAANDGLRGGEIWSMAECLNLVIDTEPQIGPTGSGSIDLTIEGGLPPYTILWSNGDTTEDISGLEPGLYTATVSDASGCLSEVSAEILLVNGVSSLLADAQLSLFPNPTTAEVRIEVSGGKIQQVELFDLQGCLHHQASIQGNPSAVDVSLPKLLPGVYLLRVRTDQGAASRKLILR